MALTDGLELAINFNSDVLDKSGNGRDGTVNGMTYDTTTPIIGSGTGVFDGINDSVEIDVTGDKSGILDLTAGTLAIWTRFPNALTELIRIFSVGQPIASPGADEWYILYRGDIGNYLQLICRNNTILTTNATTPNNTINDNDKHLVIVRADGSNPLEVYVDNSSQTLSGTTSDNFFGSAVDAVHMYIAALVRDTTFIDGRQDLDAIAVWNRALTTDEMTEYWNGGAGIELPVVVAGRPTLMLRGVGR